MKVAFLLTDFSHFGAQKVAIDLYNNMGGGVEVSFVVNSETGPFQSLLKGKTPIFTMGALPRPEDGMLRKLYVHTRNALELTRIVRRHNIELLNSFTPYTNLYALAAKFLLVGQVRVLVSEHAHVTTALKDPSSSGRLFQKLYRAGVMPLAYRFANRVVTIAESSREDLRLAWGVPAQKLVMIPNPVDWREIERQSTLTPEKTGLWTGKRFLVAAGRLENQKNFKDLIEAFQRISTEFPEVQLLILGEGSLRGELEKQVAQLALNARVSLPGFVLNPYPFFKGAYAFVLTSVWEGLPKVIAEAMACGTPVLSVDCPSGPSEMINNGVTGLLVPQSVDAVAAGLRELLSNLAQRDRFAEKAASTVRENYDPTTIAARYTALFKDA